MYFNSNTAPLSKTLDTAHLKEKRKESSIVFTKLAAPLRYRCLGLKLRVYGVAPVALLFLVQTRQCHVGGDAAGTGAAVRLRSSTERQGELQRGCHAQWPSRRQEVKNGGPERQLKEVRILRTMGVLMMILIIRKGIYEY